MKSYLHVVNGGWAQSVRRWIGMVGWPGLLSATMSLLTLLGISLLFREMKVNEAGYFALLIALSDILSLVALLGFGTTIIRHYSASSPGEFDWPLDLAGTLGFSLPVVSVGTLAFLIIYGFTVGIGLYLVILTCLGTTLAAANSMLNSRGRYAWSAVLMRAPNSMLLLPGLYGVLAFGEIRLSIVLSLYLAATGLALTAAVLVLRRVMTRGSLHISVKQRIQGVAFMATAATEFLSSQGLIAVAGLILPLQQLAGFAAIALFMRPFRLLRGLLAMILAPDLLRFRRRSYGRLLFGIWGLALLCGVGAIFLVPPIAKLFYGDRYKEALFLVPSLAFAGVLLIAIVVPRADLSVRAPMQVVSRFALAYFLVMASSLTLSIFGLLQWGVIFLSAAIILLQITETGVAYAFWVAFRRLEHRAVRP